MSTTYDYSDLERANRRGAVSFDVETDAGTHTYTYEEVRELFDSLEPGEPYRIASVTYDDPAKGAWSRADALAAEVIEQGTVKFAGHGRVPTERELYRAIALAAMAEAAR